MKITRKTSNLVVYNQGDSIASGDNKGDKYELKLTAPDRVKKMRIYSSYRLTSNAFEMFSIYSDICNGNILCTGDSVNGAYVYTGGMGHFIEYEFDTPKALGSSFNAVISSINESATLAGNITFLFEFYSD